MIDVNLIWILIISILVFNALAILMMTFFVALCCFLIKNRIGELVSNTIYIADMMEEKLGFKEGTHYDDPGDQV